MSSPGWRTKDGPPVQRGRRGVRLAHLLLTGEGYRIAESRSMRLLPILGARLCKAQAPLEHWFTGAAKS
jgi:hypothetical protein